MDSLLPLQNSSHSVALIFSRFRHATVPFIQKSHNTQVKSAIADNAIALGITGE
jgi:hypothetical protein